VRTDPTSRQAVIQPPVVAGVTTAATGLVARGDERRRPLPVGEFESLVRLVMVTQGRVVPRGRRGR
jgi:hypothetical protein